MPSFLNEYLEHIAFERLLIGRVVPVVPRDAGSSSGTYDLKTGRTHFAIMVHETAGMTLDQAVLKLGIVPLAMGAAWKALDLLMEYALDADGIAPNRGKRWTIEEKVDHARQNRGSVPFCLVTPRSGPGSSGLTPGSRRSDTRSCIGERLSMRAGCLLEQIGKARPFPR
ncbi:MAG: hypothetical protein M3P53_02110 [Actinomycetota bacterium]|nr:hypothetical protein [Actinomycetota bacterium]